MPPYCKEFANESCSAYYQQNSRCSNWFFGMVCNGYSTLMHMQVFGFREYSTSMLAYTEPKAMNLDFFFIYNVRMTIHSLSMILMVTRREVVERSLETATPISLSVYLLVWFSSGFVFTCSYFSLTSRLLLFLPSTDFWSSCFLNVH